MNEKMFPSFLGLIMVPYIIQLIANEKHISFLEAGELFYTSKVYEMLENEETKFWHFSHHMLCRLYLEEEETGTFEIPEGVA